MAGWEYSQSAQTITTGTETVTLAEINCNGFPSGLGKAKGTVFAYQVDGPGRATWDFNFTVEITSTSTGESYTAVAALVASESLTKQGNAGSLGYGLAVLVSNLENPLDNRIYIKATGVLGQTIKWAAAFENSTICDAVL